MKKPVLYFVIAFFTVVTVSFGFKTHPKTNITPDLPQNSGIEIPSDVQSLLDRSCLPCHGPDGSGKPKMKWNYEKMGDYTTSKLVGKLVKINEVVSEEDMPPPKKIKKNPELKLTSEERDVLAKWADEAAQSLAGGSD